MPEPRPVVFVPDDDPDVRAALRRLIHSVGLDVETFTSASEFLNADRRTGHDSDIHKRISHLWSSLKVVAKKLTPFGREVAPPWQRSIPKAPLRKELVFTSMHFHDDRAHCYKKSGAVMTHGTKKSAKENCVRIKELGYGSSHHIRMYGEQLEIVSDPVPNGDGDGVSVQVISAAHPLQRTLRLPTSILVGFKDFFPKLA